MTELSLVQRVVNYARTLENPELLIYCPLSIGTAIFTAYRAATVAIEGDIGGVIISGALMGISATMAGQSTVSLTYSVFDYFRN